MSSHKGSYGHTFEDYFKRALNPIVILSLLQERPKYAYEMTQELRTRTDGSYTMPLLYPVLYRLEEQGYIEQSAKIISENNRVRNYYRITPEGKEYLRKTAAEYVRLCGNVRQLVDLPEEPKRRIDKCSL